MMVSKALMFVFDPTQHAQIRKLCFGKTDDPQVSGDVSSFRQDLILSEATRRIRAETRLQQGQKRSQASDSDSDKVPHGAGMSRGQHFPRIGFCERWKRASVSSTLGNSKPSRRHFRNMLVKLATEIVSTAEAFSEDVTYIPVSALGCSRSILERRRWRGYTFVAGDSSNDIQPIWSEIPLLYAIHRSRSRLSAGDVTHPM